jgi:hypothetical protein
MPETAVFLLDIIDSNSLHGPVRELHQDNGMSNPINLYYLAIVASSSADTARSFRELCSPGKT